MTQRAEQMVMAMKILKMFMWIGFFCSAIHAAAEDEKNQELGEAIEKVRDSFGSMTTEESSVATDVDFSHKSIVSRQQKTCLIEDLEYTDVEDSDSYLDADDLSDRIKVQVGEETNRKKVHILSLSSTLLDDKAFAEITEQLLPVVSFKDHNGILDLSLNSLTPASSLQFIRWIDEGQVRFINLHGNPKCHMRYIGNLCKTLKRNKNDDMEEVKRLMSHIIFLPSYYIYQASKKVKIYRQLYELGYLPRNWPELHKQFYTVSSKKPVTFPEELLSYDPDADVSFEE